MNILIIVAIMVTMLCGIEARVIYRSVLEDEGTSIADQDSRVLGCRGGSVLLSRNSSLAPPELVEASGYVASAPPKNVYNSVLTWCTRNDDPDPFIDLQFTSPMLLTMMATTGTNSVNPSNRLGTYYVTNFTLEYSSPQNSSLMEFYPSTSGTEDLDEKKYFSAPDFNTLFQFERPFLTRRIRLRPVDWYDSDGNAFFGVQFLCQGVALYGCLESQVMELSSSTNTSNKSLAIALPVMLITISALVLLLAALACFIVKTHLNGSRREKGGTTGQLDAMAYSHLDRSQQSLASTSMDKNNSYTETHSHNHLQKRETSVVKKVDNPIYGGESTKNDHVAYANTESQYESIVDSRHQQLPSSDTSRVEEATIELRYEPVEIALTDSLPQIGTPDSMVDNALYNKTDFSKHNSIVNYQ